MIDPYKTVSEAEQAANAAVQSEGPKAVAFFSRPVPLWACFVALLVGAVLARIA